MTKLGQEGPRYRIEHRGSNGARVLAIVADVFPHWTTLVPYVSRLLREGAAGIVVLLDDSTGTVLATYRLGSGMRRRSCFRSRPLRPGKEDSADQSDDSCRSAVPEGSNLVPLDDMTVPIGGDVAIVERGPLTRSS